MKAKVLFFSLTRQGGRAFSLISLISFRSRFIFRFGINLSSWFVCFYGFWCVCYVWKSRGFGFWIWERKFLSFCVCLFSSCFLYSTRLKSRLLKNFRQSRGALSVSHLKRMERQSQIQIVIDLRPYLPFFTHRPPYCLNYPCILLIKTLEWISFPMESHSDSPHYARRRSGTPRSHVARLFLTSTSLP